MTERPSPTFDEFHGLERKRLMFKSHKGGRPGNPEVNRANYKKKDHYEN